MKICTIGFTQKSAETFFGLLGESGVRRVVDIRLNNSSQLAGFAKRDDLRYFLWEINGIDYVHETSLAPTEDILVPYRKKDITWAEFKQQFIQLLREREVEQNLDRAVLDQACLLCSEAEPHYCHRLLVAEYLAHHWGEIEIRHLE